jgi:PAS domain S-box-containing protein
MTLSTRGVFSSRFTERHWLLRYGLALVIHLVVVGSLILNSKTGLNLPLTIPIILGLVAAVWYGGTGPGVFLCFLYQGTTALLSPIPPELGLFRAWFGYVSILLFFLFLVLLIRIIQRAGQTVSEQRDLLQVTLSSIGDGVVATDTEGNITFMNGVAENLTGWKASEARGQPLGTVIKILNEHTREEVPNPAFHALQTGKVVGLANHSLLVSRDGRQIPIDDSAAPIRDGKVVKGVVLVFSDVTERKLAERSRRETEIMHCIVEAQESERHRIARGLHDQLGQQMTALRLKVDALARKFSQSDGLAGDLADVQGVAIGIDRDIGFLSWELKPTELEDLGLANALSSFVREWSSQYGIEAEFQSTLETDPVLSRQTETNLYRIAQEALNNVLRHADAKAVSVILQQQRSNLVLIVEDDGIGFEQDNGHGLGMGLAGMRERAALLNGELEVDSQPGEGTAVIVKIPYEANTLSTAVVA